MRYIFLFLLVFSSFKVSADEYVTAQPKKGDGIYSLLTRYGLSYSESNKTDFFSLNKGNFQGEKGLILGKDYKLPIKIYKYNGKSIRSTIGNNDYEYAVRIQKYNERMHKIGVKSGDFRQDKILWVPVHFSESKPAKPHKKVVRTYEIFGEDYKDVEITSNILKDHVYYIVGGHGGPDPGAVGKKAGHFLHEDEYAYDVSLRLARNLIQYGATVYIIVRDPDDGIRDDKYLEFSYDEYYLGNASIPVQQGPRLRKRASIINRLAAKHKNAKSQQVIVIHVDSRTTNKRIDIFFYYAKGSETGEKMANTLLETIEAKYEAAQPGRGYHGTVSTRNLYMLNNTTPTCIYIELGNIQNPRDQIRFIEKDNRQAIANWLKDGLINSLEE